MPSGKRGAFNKSMENLEMKNRIPFTLGSLLVLAIFFLVLYSNPVSGSNEESLELTKIGQVANVPDGYDVHVDEAKEIAYLSAGYSGVYIFNVTDPTNPIELSHIPSANIPGQGAGYAHQFLIQDDIMFVGDGIGGIKIIDCSDPSNPVVMKQFVDGYAWSARISGDDLFIPHGYFDVSGEISVVNVTDLTNPIILEHSPTDGAASDIEIQGNFAYVSSSYAGFTVFDVSNHSNLTKIGNWTGPSTNGLESGDLEIIDDLIYLSYWEHGFRIFNVSDPTSIVVVKEFTEYTGLFSVHVERDQNLAFLSDHTLGLVVLDVSDPTEPFEITRYYDGGKPCMVHIVDDIVYMTDQDVGLVILKMEGSGDYMSGQSSSNGNIPSFELPVAIMGFFFFVKFRKRI